MKSHFEDLTPEIQTINESYFDLMADYLAIEDNNPSRAFTLARQALFLSESYITLQSEAGKLARAHGEPKNDMQQFFYQRYRTLQLAHEHLRAIWRVADDRIKADRYSM
jgi:hypothetical protein